MKKYSVFGLALAIILAIFLFIPTKKKSAGDEMMPGMKTGLSFEQYQSQFHIKQTDSIKAQLSVLEENLAKAEDSLSKTTAYSNYIEFYNSISSPELSSWMVYRKAELIRNTNSWKLTGDNFFNILVEGKADTSLLSEINSYAIKSYEKSIELDSNNVASKLRLGEILISTSSNPMNGVQLLLSVVRKDSTNVEAQLLLARFGLQSQQYEKVLQRLKIVLSLQPQNLDALMMRAEVNAQSGKMKEAIEDLKSVKMNPKTSKELRNQLDIYIKDLEQKK